jgi:peptidoglycan/LPS O-acetylase OafA/YrhL
MDVALALILAIIAVGFLCVWNYALWRGWRHASRDHTRIERQLALSGVAVLMLLPVALAVVGASDGTAKVVIATAIAVVLPFLIVIGARAHRRRERRIQAPSRHLKGQLNAHPGPVSDRDFTR